MTIFKEKLRLIKENINLDFTYEKSKTFYFIAF